MVELTTAEAFNLFQEVDRFYDDQQNFKTLVKCITCSRRTVPLGVIDYFVRIYAHMYNITVPIDGAPRSVFKIYRTARNSYGQKFYNVFKKGKAFMYTKHGLGVRVTLGQLAIFRDVIRYNLLEYIKLHQNDIVVDMNKYNSMSDRSAYSKAKQEFHYELYHHQPYEIPSIPLVSIIPPPPFYNNFYDLA